MVRDTLESKRTGEQRAGTVHAGGRTGPYTDRCGCPIVSLSKERAGVHRIRKAEIFLTAGTEQPEGPPCRSGGEVPVVTGKAGQGIIAPEKGLPAQAIDLCR
jgi:hypothetical protein